MITPHEPTGGTPDDAPKFSLGQTVATAAAVASLSQDDILQALHRHHHGDWGEVCDEDRASNEEALVLRLRLLSVYRAADDTKFWMGWDAAIDVIDLNLATCETKFP